MTQTCSHSTKLIVTAIIAIVIISALTAFAYHNSNASLRDAVQSGLKSTASVMATQISANDLKGLKPGDDNTTQYLAVAAKLRAMRSMNDQLLNAYIIKVNTTDMSASFLVDDLYPLDPSGSARIGQADTSPDKVQIFEALSGPTASPMPYTDSWGSFMSAYAPIDDSAGNTYAILGLDVSENDYVASTTHGAWIIVTGIVSIVIVLSALYLFGRKTEEESPKAP